jgi:hypothetical protein
VERLTLAEVGRTRPGAVVDNVRGTPECWAVPDLLTDMNLTSAGRNL